MYCLTYKYIVCQQIKRTYRSGVKIDWIRIQCFRKKTYPDLTYFLFQYRPKLLSKQKYFSFNLTKIIIIWHKISFECYKPESGWTGYKISRISGQRGYSALVLFRTPDTRSIFGRDPVHPYQGNHENEYKCPGQTCPENLCVCGKTHFTELNLKGNIVCCLASFQTNLYDVVCLVKGEQQKKKKYWSS